MGRAFSTHTTRIGGGIEIWLDYNDNNLRIGAMNWILGTGVTMRVRIWENGALVYERSAAGPESGSQNVAGNRSMRQVTDEAGTYLDVPANIVYQIDVQTSRPR